MTHNNHFLTFEVAGHPEPAGSKKTVPAGGRYVVVDANPRSKGWKKVVAQVAQAAMLKERWQKIEGACYLSLTFFVERPKSHFRANGELSSEGNRRPYPSKRPDVLKLARGVEDALTDAGLYTDDSLIVDERLQKRWGEREGVLVTVLPL